MNSSMLLRKGLNEGRRTKDITKKCEILKAMFELAFEETRDKI